MLTPTHPFSLVKQPAIDSLRKIVFFVCVGGGGPWEETPLSSPPSNFLSFYIDVFFLILDFFKDK